MVKALVVVGGCATTVVAAYPIGRADWSFLPTLLAGLAVITGVLLVFLPLLMIVTPSPSSHRRSPAES